jgi:hypothetical protein
MTTNLNRASIMISQKLTQDQEDKVDMIISTSPQRPDQTDRVLYSTIRLDDRQVFYYKSVPEDNTVSFQLKPPVKSWFNNIPGPY